MGTKQIDEDGLLDLIRTLPTPSKTARKKTTPAAASKKTKAKSKSKSPAPPGPAKPSSVKSHDPQPATPTSSRLTSTKSFYGSAPSTSPSVPKPSSGKCIIVMANFSALQEYNIVIIEKYLCLHCFFIPCRTPKFALGRQVSASLN